jgi:hypothetical protein
MTDTPNLGLPFIADSQAQKHVTHNDALRILDAVIQIAVADMTLTAPPAAPADNERHVVATGASGAWSGHDGAIATWQDGAWSFLVPKAGWHLWSMADSALYIHDGIHWTALSGAAGSIDKLGVNAIADDTNRFSVRSNAALLAAIATADGGSGDMRLQLSKEADGNTASVFFSDHFSGRAEFGLVESDAFRLKVSADGASWIEAMTFDTATGKVSFPASGGPREVLTANRIYYVRGDGDDANDGLANTGAGAFATIQAAVDAAAAIDLSVHDVTIQLGDGSYPGAIVFRTLTGAGRVTIQGNATTPADTLVSVSGMDAFSGAGFTGRYQLKNVKIKAATGNALTVQGAGAYVEIGDGVDFGTAALAHLRANLGATISIVGNYTISGGAQRHWSSVFGGAIYAPAVTITLTGTPAFSEQFALASTLGAIQAAGVTFAGAATGPRYYVLVNGVISTGAGVLPGDAIGSTATGGQYV